MRLDKYLKVSRVIKRRTIAKDIIDLGFVFINNKQAKPGSEVKENDILTLNLGDKQLTIKVVNIEKVMNKKEASTMYEILQEEKI